MANRDQSCVWSIRRVFVEVKNNTNRTRESVLLGQVHLCACLLSFQIQSNGDKLLLAQTFMAQTSSSECLRNWRMFVSFCFLSPKRCRGGRGRGNSRCIRFRNSTDSFTWHLVGSWWLARNNIRSARQLAFPSRVSLDSLDFCQLAGTRQGCTRWRPQAAQIVAVRCGTA